MIRTQISITEEQQQALRRLATLRSVSQAEVIREALDALVEHDARLQRLERARNVVGRYRSGHSSTSTDHDEALVEAFSA